MTGRLFLLTPSGGLGGGIERYAETLEWAFAAQGLLCQRVDLQHAGVGAHAGMVADVRRMLRHGDTPARLVVAHRSLLPAACLLARERNVCGISLICHGGEVWGSRRSARRYVERRLMGRADVHVAAASNFTAGVLAKDSPATILPPGLSEAWFRTLVTASEATGLRPPGACVATAFRLSDWQRKGLPELLSAVAALGRPDVHLVICGSGQPPSDLQHMVARHPFCQLRSGLSDRELADQLAAADLFVLATRTRGGRHPSGEGFGLVLLEAQVAGTPVVAPAYGGSHDAFINGVTGIAPANETAGALAAVLAELLDDVGRLQEMGKRAAEWSRECFGPDRYCARVVSRLL
jgi:glycosyltransferase involved in cell wall biosynthesis